MRVLCEIIGAGILLGLVYAGVIQVLALVKGKSNELK